MLRYSALYPSGRSYALDRCPQCPDRDRFRLRSKMTRCAKAQPDSRAAANGIIFNNLVGARWQSRGNVDAKHTCGLQIDDEFERGRLQNRLVRRLSTFEDASVSAAALTFPVFQSLKSSFLQAGTASFLAIARIADGNVVEMWHVQNTTGLLQQLGAGSPAASKNSRR